MNPTNSVGMHDAYKSRSGSRRRSSGYQIGDLLGTHKRSSSQSSCASRANSKESVEKKKSSKEQTARGRTDGKRKRSGRLKARNTGNSSPLRAESSPSRLGDYNNNDSHAIDHRSSSTASSTSRKKEGDWIQKNLSFKKLSLPFSSKKCGSELQPKPLPPLPSSDLFHEASENTVPYLPITSTTKEVKENIEKAIRKPTEIPSRSSSMLPLSPGTFSVPPYSLGRGGGGLLVSPSSKSPTVGNHLVPSSSHAATSPLPVPRLAALIDPKRNVVDVRFRTLLSPIVVVVLLAMAIFLVAIPPLYFINPDIDSSLGVRETVLNRQLVYIFVFGSIVAGVGGGIQYFVQSRCFVVLSQHLKHGNELVSKQQAAIEKRIQAEQLFFSNWLELMEEKYRMIDGEEGGEIESEDRRGSGGMDGTGVGSGLWRGRKSRRLTPVPGNPRIRYAPNMQAVCSVNGSPFTMDDTSSLLFSETLDRSGAKAKSCPIERRKEPVHCNSRDDAGPNDERKETRADPKREIKGISKKEKKDEDHKENVETRSIYSGRLSLGGGSSTIGSEGEESLKEEQVRSVEVPASMRWSGKWQDPSLHELSSFAFSPHSPALVCRASSAPLRPSLAASPPTMPPFFVMSTPDPLPFSTPPLLPFPAISPSCSFQMMSPAKGTEEGGLASTRRNSSRTQEQGDKPNIAGSKGAFPSFPFSNGETAKAVLSRIPRIASFRKSPPTAASERKSDEMRKEEDHGKDAVLCADKRKPEPVQMRRGTELYPLIDGDSVVVVIGEKDDNEREEEEGEKRADSLRPCSSMNSPCTQKLDVAPRECAPFEVYDTHRISSAGRMFSQGRGDGDVSLLGASFQLPPSLTTAQRSSYLPVLRPSHYHHSFHDISHPLAVKKATVYELLKTEFDTLHETLHGIFHDLYASSNGSVRMLLPLMGALIERVHGLDILLLQWSLLVDHHEQFEFFYHQWGSGIPRSGKGLLGGGGGPEVRGEGGSGSPEWSGSPSLFPRGRGGGGDGNSNRMGPWSRLSSWNSKSAPTGTSGEASEAGEMGWSPKEGASAEAEVGTTELNEKMAKDGGVHDIPLERIERKTIPSAGSRTPKDSSRHSNANSERSSSSSGRNNHNNASTSSSIQQISRTFAGHISPVFRASHSQLGSPLRAASPLFPKEDFLLSSKNTMDKVGFTASSARKERNPPPKGDGEKTSASPSPLSDFASPSSSRAPPFRGVASVRDVWKSKHKKKSSGAEVKKGDENHKPSMPFRLAPSPDNPEGGRQKKKEKKSFSPFCHFFHGSFKKVAPRLPLPSLDVLSSSLLPIFTPIPLAAFNNSSARSTARGVGMQSPLHQEKRKGMRSSFFSASSSAPPSLVLHRGNRFPTDNKNVFFYIILNRVEFDKERLQKDKNNCKKKEKEENKTKEKVVHEAHDAASLRTHQTDLDLRNARASCEETNEDGILRSSSIIIFEAVTTSEEQPSTPLSHSFSSLMPLVPPFPEMSVESATKGTSTAGRGEPIPALSAARTSPILWEATQTPSRNLSPVAARIKSAEDEERRQNIKEHGTCAGESSQDKRSLSVPSFPAFSNRDGSTCSSRVGIRQKEPWSPRIPVLHDAPHSSLKESTPPHKKAKKAQGSSCSTTPRTASPDSVTCSHSRPSATPNNISSSLTIPVSSLPSTIFSKCSKKKTPRAEVRESGSALIVASLPQKFCATVHLPHTWKANTGEEYREDDTPGREREEERNRRGRRKKGGTSPRYPPLHCSFVPRFVVVPEPFTSEAEINALFSLPSTPSCSTIHSASSFVLLPLRANVTTPIVTEPVLELALFSTLPGATEKEAGEGNTPTRNKALPLPPSSSPSTSPLRFSTPPSLSSPPHTEGVPYVMHVIDHLREEEEADGDDGRKGIQTTNRIPWLPSPMTLEDVTTTTRGLPSKISSDPLIASTVLEASPPASSHGGVRRVPSFREWEMVRFLCLGRETEDGEVLLDMKPVKGKGFQSISSSSRKEERSTAPLVSSPFTNVTPWNIHTDSSPPPGVASSPPLELFPTSTNRKPRFFFLNHERRTASQAISMPIEKTAAAAQDHTMRRDHHHKEKKEVLFRKDVSLLAQGADVGEVYDPRRGTSTPRAETTPAWTAMSSTANHKKGHTSTSGTKDIHHKENKKGKQEKNGSTGRKDSSEHYVLREELSMDNILPSVSSTQLPFQSSRSMTMTGSSSLSSSTSPCLFALPESFLMSWSCLPPRPMRLTFLGVQLASPCGTSGMSSSSTTHQTVPLSFLEHPSPSTDSTADQERKLPPSTGAEHTERKGEAPQADPTGNGAEWDSNDDMTSLPFQNEGVMAPVLECMIDEVLCVLLHAIVTVDVNTNKICSIQLEGKSIECMDPVPFEERQEGATLQGGAKGKEETCATSMASKVKEEVASGTRVRDVSHPRCTVGSESNATHRYSMTPRPEEMSPTQGMILVSDHSDARHNHRRRGSRASGIEVSDGEPLWKMRSGRGENPNERMSNSCQSNFKVMIGDYRKEIVCF